VPESRGGGDGLPIVGGAGGRLTRAAQLLTRRRPIGRPLRDRVVDVRDCCTTRGAKILRVDRRFNA